MPSEHGPSSTQIRDLFVQRFRDHLAEWDDYRLVPANLRLKRAFLDSWNDSDRAGQVVLAAEMKSLVDWLHSRDPTPEKAQEFIDFVHGGETGPPNVDMLRRALAFEELDSIATRIGHGVEHSKTAINYLELAVVKETDAEDASAVLKELKEFCNWLGEHGKTYWNLVEHLRDAKRKARHHVFDADSPRSVIGSALNSYELKGHHSPWEPDGVTSLSMGEPISRRKQAIYGFGFAV